MKALSKKNRTHIEAWIEKTWNSYKSEDSDPVQELLDVHDAQQIEIEAQRTELEWLRRERQEVREVLGVHGSDTMTAPAARGVMIKHARERGIQIGEILSIEKHVADLMPRIEKLERITHQACPCLHTTPCHDRCTCINGWSSSGCMRCCSYGSKEQRKVMAEHLAGTWDNARERLLHSLYHIREMECIEDHDESGEPCPRRAAKEAIDNRPCSLCEKAGNR